MEEELKEILNVLEDCYFEELTKESYYDNVIWYFKEKYKKPFTYDSGASKLVLIFSNLDFVIKIPFSGMYGEGEIYDEETGDYYDSDFIEFCGAEGDNSCWDYCEAEAGFYQNAVNNNIEQCFAKTEKIAEIKGYPIYKQELVHLYNCGESSSHTEEDTKQMNEMCDENSFDCFNEDWLSDVFSYYGEEIFYKFMDFISYMGINDLHDGNIGYRKGRPVLMDYSGWSD